MSTSTPGADDGNNTGSLTSRIASAPARIWCGVVAREYRPLLHMLACAVIIAASCLLFYQNFTKRGILMHVDMTWATSLDRINEIYRHTWLQYGSGVGTFYLMAMLWEYPLLLLAQLLHLSTSSYLLIMFVSTVSLAGISMYAFAYTTISSFDFTDTWRYAPFLGSVVAGLIYIYNPWSLGHLWPYYMYPAYALMPLVLIVLVRAYRSPRPGYVILLAFLLALATNAPINVIWLWLLVLGYVLFRLLQERFRKESLLRALKVAGGSLLLYVLIEAYWIFPYMWTRFSGNAPIPSYTVDQSMLGGLSMNNTILNNLRLVAGWAYPVKVNPDNTLALFLTMTLPLLTILGLILMRGKIKENGTVIYLAALSLVAITLATGTSFFARRLYTYVTLEMPSAQSLGWLIRVPDRWLVYVPMLYALIIGALCAMLLRKRPRSTLSEDSDGDLETAAS